MCFLFIGIFIKDIQIKLNYIIQIYYERLEQQHNKR